MVKAYGSLQTSSSQESNTGVMRFETLENSIEGALHELECIDADAPSLAEECLSCEESSASDLSEHEGPPEVPEVDLEESAPRGLQSDPAVMDRKLKSVRSSTGAKSKPPRLKGEKKGKAKAGAKAKKARQPALPKPSSESLLEQAAAPAPAEAPPEAEHEPSEAERKLKALLLKQNAEREGWAFRLRKAKEMGLEIVSKVL